MLRLRVHGHRRPAVLVQRPGRITEDGLDARDVVKMNRLAVPPREHHVVEALDAVLARESDRIRTPADVLKSAGHVGVVTGEPSKSGYFDAQRRGLIRVESDPHLPVSAAVDVSRGDTRDLLDFGLDDFLHEILIAGDVAVVTGKGLDGKPGDGGAETPAPRIDDRLVHIGRITRHAVEPIHHLDQRSFQPSIDAKIEGDGSVAAARGRLDFLQSGQAAKRILLGLDDLRFDLLGRRRPPPGIDLDERSFNVGDHLDRHADERDGPEHQDHDDADDDGHRVGNGRASQVQESVLPSKYSPAL